MEPDFVIEEDLRRKKKTELSAQFLVDQEGKTHFIRTTRNLVHVDGTHIYWRGNMVAGSSKHAINRMVSRTTMKKLIEIVEYFAVLGYRGYLGVDLMKMRSGRIKVLEINGRITGATGVLLVLEQLMRERKTSSLVAAYIQELHLAWLPRVEDFFALLKRLGDLAYTRKKGSGVISTFATTLPKSFGAVLVARHPKALRTLQKDLYARLGINDHLTL